MARDMLATEARFPTIGLIDDLVFVGAQSAGAGSRLPADEQLAAAIEKLGSALREAGLNFDDVVKVGLFYDQSLLGDEPTLLDKLGGLFGSRQPAPVVTALPLRRLPYGELVQVELVALKRGSRRSNMRTAFGRGVDGFSAALQCDDLIFVGATQSVDSRGEIVEQSSIVGQARLTMSNLKAAVTTAGGEPQSVVKLNTYYVGQGTVADWGMAAQVRATAFEKPGPTATGVPLPGPFPSGVLLRQEAMAVVNTDGSPRHRDTSWPKGVYDWPIPVTFEQCLKIDRLIIVGGQVSCSTTGTAVHPGDLRAQTKRTMESIATLLGGFDRNCDCLAKLTIFYATRENGSELDCILEIVGSFFSKRLPALTLVPLEKLGLEGLEIEIEGLGVDA